MRKLVLAAALVFWAHASWAQDAAAPASAAQDIRRVITAQIEAFRRDDGDAAMAFAAPGIVRMFGDGATFLSMVRTHYPSVYHPRSFSFGALSVAGGAVQQKVAFIGADGEAAVAIYDMEHESDDRWRIAGCVLERTEAVEL